MVISRSLAFVLLCTALLALLSGCEKARESATPSATATAPSAETPADEGLDLTTQHSWAMAANLHKQVQPQVTALQAAITEFLATPTADSLQQARSQWQLTHNSLQQLAPLFALGEASPSLFAQLRQAQFEVDAWPIEPGYLDYFDVYPHSGIVNDIVITVDEASIRDQHGFTSDSDVSLGMHTMAYLLWGQGQQRPASDFIPAKPTPLQQQGGIKPRDLPNQRRAALLQLQAELLTQDMAALGYKLSQPASGLNTFYGSLSALAQLQLWQQSIHHLLIQLKQQLPPPEPDTNDEFYAHNQFAGSQATMLAATLKGLQFWLLDHAEGTQPLAYWLNPKGDLEALEKHLTAAQSALIDADKPWDTVTPEQAQALREQLRPLLGWFPQPVANP